MKFKPSLSVILLFLILLACGYLVFVVANPLQALAIRNERKIVESAAKQADVPFGEFQFMAELGKTQGFDDIEKLQKLSKYNEEVYKDAKKGDRAIAFASKMILYRPSTSKIIYMGESPGQKQLKDQQALLQKVIDVVKDSGYIAKDSKEVPQVLTVNNASQLRENQFYAQAADGDLVLVFNNQGLYVLYSSKDQKVLNAARTRLELVGQTPAGGAQVSPTPARR